MKIIGWIDSMRYANIEYYFALKDIDVLENYSFKRGAVSKDVARRRAAVSVAMTESLGVPHHVRRTAVDRRSASP